MEAEIRKDLEKIKMDLELIKNLLSDCYEDGELSDWAKEELANTRANTRKVSNKEVRLNVLGNGL